MTIDHDLKRIINQTIRNTGNFPTPREICNSMSFTEEQTYKAMESLAEDGYLERQGSWYKFPENQQLSEPEEIFENVPNPHIELYDQNGDISEPPKRKRGRPFGTTKKWIEDQKPRPHETFVEEKVVSKQSRDYKSQIKIIQVLMAVIGSGASIISIYYSYLWMQEFLPFVLAILFAVIIVGFSVMAFETIIVFLSGQITDSKWIKIGVASGFILLWSVATFFSIASTIAGQVNKNLQKTETKIQTSDYNSKEQWKILQDQKSDAKERLSDYRQQIKTYNQILSGLNNARARQENKATWNDVNYKLSQTQKSVSTVTDEMENIRAQEKKILTETKGKSLVTAAQDVEGVDFYIWMAKVLGVRADRIQFILALFFAVFIDLIAPTSLAVSLFLRNK